MIPHPPSPTRTYPLFPYTLLFRSFFDRIDDASRRRFLLVIPNAPVRQFGCELLAEEARHMLAGRRKAVVDGRGDQHLDNRRLRPAELLCVEEGAVHIVERRREDDPRLMMLARLDRKSTRLNSSH